MHYLLILLPFVVFLVAKIGFNHKFNFQEVFLGVLICSLTSVGITQISRYSKMSDTETWNGKVTSKKMRQENCKYPGWYDYSDSFCTNENTREVYTHSTYTTDYCTDSNGKRYACGETETKHYKTQYRYDFPWERKWMVYTNLRTDQISRIDRQGVNEPPRWTKVMINDPVSVTKSYDNYIKAVPDSLFNNSAAVNNFSNKVPSYPTANSFYTPRKVLSVGYKGNIDVSKLNYDLGKALGRLNPRKQVNIIIILTSIADPSYRHAVEFKWVGGKKNDVVIFLGMDADEVIWTDIMTFGKNKFNGIYTAQLSGALSDMETLTADNQEGLISNVEKLTMKHYDRPKMKDYEYLKNEIKPSKGAVIAAFIVDLLLCVGLLWVFHTHDFDPVGNIWKAAKIKWSELKRRCRMRRR